MTDKLIFKTFGEQTIKEIKMWAWAAAVMPIVALASIFFIWAFGTDEMLNIAMVVGGSTMFLVAVVWWWWALHSIYKLLVLWSTTDLTVVEVKNELKEIKTAVKDLFFLKR
jgi:uncharacterized membrane protein YfbV (UPF0208 family)